MSTVTGAYAAKDAALQKCGYFQMVKANQCAGRWFEPFQELESAVWDTAVRNLSGKCHSIELHYCEMWEIAMAANALVQTRIDAEVRDRASAVLESMGLTVSDAVRIMLTRTANEGALPLELLSGSEAHDAWFRTKVLEALNDTRPDLSDDEVEAHFAKRRAAALLKAGARES